MFSRLFKSQNQSSVPNEIYGRLMAQAREPAFYEVIGVPDSVMGRFDMLAMHVYLINRRLKVEDDPVAAELSQDIFDLFVDDIERALRELGIGDTTVPKRKKKLIHSFYAQIDEFDNDIEAADENGLSEKINSRYLEKSENGNKNALATYMLENAKALSETEYSEILKGNVTWLTVQK